MRPWVKKNSRSYQIFLFFFRHLGHGIISSFQSFISESIKNSTKNWLNFFSLFFCHIVCECSKKNNFSKKGIEGNYVLKTLRNPAKFLAVLILVDRIAFCPAGGNWGGDLGALIFWNSYILCDINIVITLNDFIENSWKCGIRFIITSINTNLKRYKEHNYEEDWQQKEKKFLHVVFYFVQSRLLCLSSILKVKFKDDKKFCFKSFVLE